MKVYAALLGEFKNASRVPVPSYYRVDQAKNSANFAAERANGGDHSVVDFDAL
jgi:hypothetical protein